ncbi:MAG: DUF4173 domain-containing protein [Cystobacter sp.]
MSLPAAPPSLPAVFSPSLRSAPRLRRPRETVLAALGLGCGAEVLLDGPGWGISFPLFVVMLLGSLLALGGREGWQRARPNAWLGLACLFFSGMVFVRASPLLTALNLCATGLLLLLLAHFWAAGRVERLGLGGYPATLLDSAWNAVSLPPLVVHSQWGHVPVRGQLLRLLPVARGALLAFPVLFLFTGLLSSADGVFAEVLNQGAHFAMDLLSWETWGRGVFALGSAFGVLGLFAHALRRRREREAGEQETTVAGSRLGFIESLTLVVLVDLLFLGFVSLQLAFMWGGARLPLGLTYSEYARRGFFELLAVSVLTLGLSLVLEQWTRLRDRAQVVAFRSACTAMVGLVLVVLASAVKRMMLYESVYGYTELRVYTHVFMGALAAVLAWRVVTLWWRPERFALGALVGGLGFLVALNLLNPDAFIARNNLNPGEGGAWDASYLSRALSVDSAPELAAYLERFPESASSLELRARLCEYQGAEQGGWRAFHLAHHRASALLPSEACRVLERAE